MNWCLIKDEFLWSHHNPDQDKALTEIEDEYNSCKFGDTYYNI